MTTMVSVPVIRTDADLAVALNRIDAIIDAPDGTPEADERATLGMLVSVYEEEHHPYPKLTGTELLARCMEAQDLNQSQVPEIGPQPLVSAVLNGKRTITHRMAIELGRRFLVPAEAFLGLSTSTASTRSDKDSGQDEIAEIPKQESWKLVELIPTTSLPEGAHFRYATKGSSLITNISQHRPMKPLKMIVAA